MPGSRVRPDVRSCTVYTRHTVPGYHSRPPPVQQGSGAGQQGGQGTCTYMYMWAGEVPVHHP